MSLIKATTTLIIFILLITTLSCTQQAEEYYESGKAKDDLKDYKGAIEDYNKAEEQGL